MKWLIPDCFWPAKDQGDYVSHEAICVLNPCETNARVSLTLYFEDREPLGGCVVDVPARRTKHIRLDRAVFENHQVIPRATPYAMIVECDLPIAVQYSRLDTTQCALALATTMVQQN